MKSLLPFSLLAIVALALPSCNPQSPPASSGEAGAQAAGPPKTSGRLVVAVANQPLAYFAARIGGTEVDVVFPAPTDEDPAFWQPGEKEITQYQSADVILLNGATYSKWVDKVSLPESKTVDTSAGFHDQLIEVKDAVTHSHGGSGEHSHGGTAFTTWIDFNQAISQADAVREAFQKARPDHMELFALNFDQLKTDLLALDAAMKKEGERLAGAPLVASHPVYQYWARRYGLNVKAVLWEPETVPNDEQMAELKKILETHPAGWMIWEGEPAAASVEKLKALGVQSAVFSPCGNVPDSGSWLDVMKANIEAMRQVGR